LIDYASVARHASACAENCLIVERRKKAGMVKDIEHFDTELRADPFG
jgi:hypothetical protein